MKIESLPLSRLRGEEHFRYQTEFKALVDAKTPNALGIATDYPLYNTRYTDEGNTLNVLIKSKISEDILLLDQTRGNTFRGISDAIYAFEKHFKQANIDAAKRLIVVLERYGKVADKPFEQETASVASFVADMQVAPNAADITTLGLTDWVAKLKADNDAFIAQLKLRDAENAAKPQVAFRDARILVDQSYKTLVNRINALIIVNGDTAYKSFVLELNEIIHRFQNLLAQRQGRNEKDAAKTGEQ
jgi:membrane-anchored protein YejM (alkaline phosphatase superfamily)